MHGHHVRAACTWGGHVRVQGHLGLPPLPEPPRGCIPSQHGDPSPIHGEGQRRKQARGTAVLRACLAPGTTQVGVIN